MLIPSILRAWVVCGVVVLCGVKCSGAQSRSFESPLLTSDDPEASRDMEQAQALEDQGKLNAAAAAYGDFLSHHVDDPLAPLAHLGLGRIALSRGDAKGARSHLKPLQAHRDRAVADQARFYDGVALHMLGQHAAALRLLKPLVGRTIDPAHTELLLKTVSASALAVNDRVLALESMDRLLRSSASDDSKAQVLNEVDGVIAQTREAEVTELLARVPAQGQVWPRLAKRGIRVAYQAGHMDRVRDIARAHEDAVGPLDGEVAALVAHALRQQEVNPRAIGAVLPLSGRTETLGNQALQGLLLAQGSAAGGAERDGRSVVGLDRDAPTLVFRDGGSDARSARQAVDELVTMHRVVAIVGGLSKTIATAAAARADELKVPFIALSPLSEAQQAKRWVFRLAYDSDEEVATLLDTDNLSRARNLCAVLPASPYGDTLAQALTRQLQRPVTAVQRFALDTRDFSQQAAALERRGCDAVLVGASKLHVRLIAPALVAVGVASNRVAVTSAAGITSLTSSDARYLQGAVLSVPFLATEGTRAVAFAKAFEGRFGAEPTYFAALAFDAFAMVSHVLSSRRDGDRDAVRTGLRDVRRDTAGPAGGFSVQKGPRRATRLYRVEGTSFYPLKSDT